MSMMVLTMVTMLEMDGGSFEDGDDDGHGDCGDDDDAGDDDENVDGDCKHASNSLLTLVRPAEMLGYKCVLRNLKFR